MQQTKPICALCRCPLPAGADQSARLCPQCASIIESIREPSAPPEQEPGQAFRFDNSGQLTYEPPRAGSFFFEAPEYDSPAQASPPREVEHNTAAPAERARAEAPPEVETVRPGRDLAAPKPQAPQSQPDLEPSPNRRPVGAQLKSEPRTPGGPSPSQPSFELSAGRTANRPSPGFQKGQGQGDRRFEDQSWAEELRKSLALTDHDQVKPFVPETEDKGYVLMVANTKEARRARLPLKVAALLLLLAAAAAGGYFLLRGGAAPAKKNASVAQAQPQSRSQPQPQLPPKGEGERPVVSGGPKPAATEAVPGGKSYSLQAASFPSEEAANQFSERLVQLGIPAYVVAADIPKKGRWFRVRVGKFPSPEKARQDAAEFQKKAAAAGLRLGLVVCDY